MPRRENPVVLERVFALAASEEGRGLGRVALTTLYRSKHGEAETPSEVTIGRYLNKFRAMSDEDQRKYAGVQWPESFERGDLLWEAAATVFELRGFLGVPESPPSLRLTRWFVRVTLAAPTAHIAARWALALKLAVSETINGSVATSDARWVEAYICAEAWTDVGRELLADWMAAGKVPDQGTDVEISWSTDMNRDVLRRMFQTMLGTSGESLMEYFPEISDGSQTEL